MEIVFDQSKLGLGEDNVVDQNQLKLDYIQENCYRTYNPSIHIS